MKTMRRLLILVVAAGALAVSQKRLDALQAETFAVQTINNPDVPVSLSIVTFALGPLRAIVVDVLWWRAMQQQDRGEYFDALQLTDWITSLQPTFASVWAFQAWNMSYNIAHAFAKPEDRWQWIERAIILLRDQGLRYNPGSQLIRQELARIYYERIGNKTDPAAQYFKNQWTFTVMNYMQYGNRDEISKMEAGAATLDELRQRPGVAEYVERCQEKGIDVLDFSANKPGLEPLPVAMPDGARMGAALEVYWHYRRTRLESGLKLDVGKMLSVDVEYGPLDWRLHQAHAIYWAAEDSFEEFKKTPINYAKVIHQSMMSSFYEGKLRHDPARNIMYHTNNLEIIERLHVYFDYLMENAYTKTIYSIHQSFLERAVTTLYSYNHLEEAQALFSHYDEDYVAGDKMKFEEFIAMSLEKTLAADASASKQSIVEVALFKAVENLAKGDYDRSNGYVKLARLLWERHQKKYVQRPGKLLPPFEKLVVTAKSRFVSQNNFDKNRLDAAEAEAKALVPTKVGVGKITPGGHGKPK